MYLTVENIYLQGISLLIKIIDTKNYLIENEIFEKSENREIFDTMNRWVDNVENEINEILSLYISKFSRSEIIDELFLKSSYEQIKYNQIVFKCILENFKFIPIQTPGDILKLLVQQTITTHVSQEAKVGNIILKNIYEFNFSESEMKKPPVRELNQKTVPVVLSMTAVYSNNPLLWPLILHEYGHAIFNTQENQKKSRLIKKQIKVFMKDNNIDENILDNNIAEVFSDLFGINYYGETYFFAFFFHEVLFNDVNTLLNLETTNNSTEFKYTSHPPSLIRVKYMIKELNKYAIKSDNFEKFSSFLKPMLDRYDQEMSVKIPNNKEIYFKIYELVSEYYGSGESTVFGGTKYSGKKDVVKQLYECLIDKMPIGTYKKNNEEVHFTNSDKNEIFDLALPSKIIDIINSGWKYFLQNLILPLYNNQENKIQYTSNEAYIKMKKDLDTFKIDYLYLLNNIIYSIETSVITSNYLGD